MAADRGRRHRFCRAPHAARGSRHAAESQTITTPDGAFGAYVARPRDRQAPAIVVIQEIFGVNAVMRGICRRLRRRGLPRRLSRPVLAHRARHRHHRPDRGRVEAGVRAVQRLRRRRRRARTSPRPSTPCPPAIRAAPARSARSASASAACSPSSPPRAPTSTPASATTASASRSTSAEADKLADPLLLHIAEEDQFVPKAAQALIIAALEEPSAGRRSTPIPAATTPSPGRAASTTTPTTPRWPTRARSAFFNEGLLRSDARRPRRPRRRTRSARGGRPARRPEPGPGQI